MPFELLYADDLILLAEIEVELCEKIVNWKAGIEVKGLKMNTEKTKVLCVRVRLLNRLYFKTSCRFLETSLKPVNRYDVIASYTVGLCYCDVTRQLSLNA